MLRHVYFAMMGVDDITREEHMTNWTQEELDKINGDEYFQLAAALADGSMPKAVDIWSVGVGDRIFVRSFNGTGGKWYGPALVSGKGHISAGGVSKDVTFVKIDDEETKQAIDTAYHAKYDPSPYAETMASDPVRDNTLEVIPVDS